MSHPIYTESEALSRQTFLALMWSMSYPGRIYDIPSEADNAFYAIADTLLDIETSFYAGDETMTAYFSRNGARALSPERASYHFYPVLTDNMLDTVNEASIGTLMYPDQSATLIIGAKFGDGLSLSITGPGIKPDMPNRVRISGLPDEFWQLREKTIRYPRGWDIYLVDGHQIVGLPRTSLITIEE